MLLLLVSSVLSAIGALCGHIECRDDCLSRKLSVTILNAEIIACLGSYL